MSFSLREFIKKGLLDAVGKMADYQIILNATGWFEKSVLTLEDLEEINKAIEESHKPEPEPTIEYEPYEEEFEEEPAGEYSEEYEPYEEEFESSVA